MGGLQEYQPFKVLAQLADPRMYRQLHDSWHYLREGAQRTATAPVIVQSSHL